MGGRGGGGREINYELISDRYGCDKIKKRDARRVMESLATSRVGGKKNCQICTIRLPTKNINANLN